MNIFLTDEEATLNFGQKIARACCSGLTIYLYGDLGAGKTTLVRGLVQSFLPGIKVKSPTYTLVEDYDVSNSAFNPHHIKHLYHFDLYRLGDPEELEYLGGRDYFSDDAVCLVEWPQRGEGWLAEADLEIKLVYLKEGRDALLTSRSDKGQKVLGTLLKNVTYEKE